MNRREFVRAGAAAAVVAKIPATKGPHVKPMNLLFVFGDQHRACAMPGHPYSSVVAPHLDAFARQNLTVENCISSYPLCVPYRAMLMSGRWPQQTGVMGNGPKQWLKGSEHGLGQCFKDAGYRTGYVGKWHLAEGGEHSFVPAGPLRFGFDYFRIWGNTNNHWHDFTWNQDTGERIVKDKWSPIAMTDDAIEFLDQQSTEQPWMLMLSWNPPHPPFDPPAECAALYDEERMQLRPNVAYTQGNGEKPKREPLQNEKALRAAQKSYYGGITGIDQQFQRLLDALAAKGLTENTVVIYTADHGEMMGSHCRMAKNVPWEESVNVPFYVRVPGAVNRGRTSKMLLGAIDIYPTLCGLAGIPVPHHCAGRDLSAALAGEPQPAQQAVIVMNEAGGGDLDVSGAPTYRGVRTATHTYAVAADGRWCLYDNLHDPYQQKNLVADPAHAPLMKELDATILAWQKSAGDRFPLEQAVEKISSYPS